jgi:hypothetical protein
MLKRIASRKHTIAATAVAVATAAALSLSGTAQAATHSGPVGAKQITRAAAKVPVGAKHKVKLTAKQRQSLQRQIERQSGRAYGEYLGPYVFVFNFSSYSEVQVQYTETFGFWQTWTHTFRLYGNTWYDFGWSVY